MPPHLGFETRSYSFAQVMNVTTVRPSSNSWTVTVSLAASLMRREIHLPKTKREASQLTVDVATDFQMLDEINHRGDSGSLSALQDGVSSVLTGGVGVTGSGYRATDQARAYRLGHIRVRFR
jgi:hypothetical protein